MDHARRWAQPRLSGTIRDAVKRSAQTKVWFAIICMHNDIGALGDKSTFDCSERPKVSHTPIQKFSDDCKYKKRWKTYATANTRFKSVVYLTSLHSQSLAVPIQPLPQESHHARRACSTPMDPIDFLVEPEWCEEAKDSSR